MVRLRQLFGEDSHSAPAAESHRGGGGGGSLGAAAPPFWAPFWTHLFTDELLPQELAGLEHVGDVVERTEALVSVFVLLLNR